MIWVELWCKDGSRVDLDDVFKCLEKDCAYLLLLMLLSTVSGFPPVMEVRYKELGLGLTS